MFFERRALESGGVRKFRMREGVFQHWTPSCFHCICASKALRLSSRRSWPVSPMDAPPAGRLQQKKLRQQTLLTRRGLETGCVGGGDKIL